MRKLRFVGKSVQKRGMSLRIPTGSTLARFFLSPIGRAMIMGGALLVIVMLGGFTFFYARYSRVIDEKLNAGPFANNARIFAAPESVGVGDAMSPNDIAAAILGVFTFFYARYSRVIDEKLNAGPFANNARIF